jgi:hypothetical protein
MVTGTSVWVRDVNGFEWESFAAPDFFEKIRKYAVENGEWVLGTDRDIDRMFHEVCDAVGKSIKIQKKDEEKVLL